MGMLRHDRGGGLMRIVLATMVLGLALLGGLYWDYQRFLNAPLPVQEARAFSVPSGASLRRVGRLLQEEGLLIAGPESSLLTGMPDIHVRYWELHGRLHEHEQRLHAGEFLITPGMTPIDLFELFASSRTVQYSLTIPEGWTFAQMLNALRQHEQIRSTLEDDAGAVIMSLLGMPDMHPEGWFFPDTYLFPRGTTDVDFLRRAHERMLKVLEQAWESRAPDLPLESAYQALILASIVERETGKDHERPMVAAVFIERLRRGMRLQTDPTVMYGLGSQDRRLTRSDLQTDTPYNTYLHAGLPPTPIALPGAAAIEASLDPADSRALFFVSKRDGSHHFSETYEEHRRAVIKYLLDGDASRYAR